MAGTGMYRMGHYVFFLMLFLVIVISGCTDDDPGDSSSTVPTASPADTPSTIKNATVMKSIIPDKPPGDWKLQTNPSGIDGQVTVVFSKPGNHRVTLSVKDMITPQLAEKAVKPDQFTYPTGSIIWSTPVETRYKNAPAIKGTYTVDGKNMGELIAYPRDRYLVTAYIIGENDKIVNMYDLLDSLTFPR